MTSISYQYPDDRCHAKNGRDRCYLDRDHKGPHVSVSGKQWK